MIVLFGPCMFVAPLLVVLIPVAIVLWPPVLLIVAIVYLLAWPFALVGRRFGIPAFVSVHARLGHWFTVLLTPWRYFDAPKK